MKIKRFRDIILRFLSQPRNFSLTAGAILFGMGIIGFAFRSEGSLPDKYLAGALVIGFWGIVSGLWDGGGKYAGRRATDKMLNER